MSNSKTTAQVQYTVTGPRPLVELIVPHGTHLKDTFRVQERISEELLSKLSPRGCRPCTSGTHFVIREELENIIQVDLAAGTLIGELPKGR
jgi:hypothetical protein